MNNASDFATGQAAVRKYELGQPIVRREQRAAFEHIHRTLAQDWSDLMTGILSQNAVIEFATLEFSAFASLPLDDPAGGQAVVFSIEPHKIGGFVMMSAALARLLVNRRLGLNSPNHDHAPFTRLETAIANETLRAMVTRLADAYASAGLGNIGKVRECVDLSDTFAPEDQLALLKFHLNAADHAMNMLVGVGANIVGALARPHATDAEARDNRGDIAAAVARLPIEVDVVLGRWSVPIAELLRLREGDRIVLPDGEDAWLSARGVRIRRANVEVTADRALLQILRSTS